MHGARCVSANATLNLKVQWVIYSNRIEKLIVLDECSITTQNTGVIVGLEGGTSVAGAKAYGHRNSLLFWGRWVFVV